MNLQTPGALIVLTMTVFCLSIDAFVVVVGQEAPSFAGNAMCFVQPLGAIVANILFPNEWSQLVSQYCATFPREPAISIIALTLKLSVVALALILTIGILPLRKTAEEASVDRSSERPRIPITLLIVFLFPVFFAWRWLIGSIPPEEFNTSLSYKIYADVFLSALYVGGVILCATFVDVALLPVLRRLFPSQY